MKLDKIIKRADRATPGPWYVVAFVQKFEIVDKHRSEVHNGIDNREFIGAARQDIPDLVSWIRRAKTFLEEYCDADGVSFAYEQQIRELLKELDS